MSPPHDEDLTRAQATLQQMTNGYWTTQIIHVAAKLGIADLLSHGPQAVDTLARATQTHAPTLSRLMRALGSLGLFRENEQGQYELTTLGQCLVSGSPGALRARAILNGEEWYRAWGTLLDSVRTGKSSFENLFGKPFFELSFAKSASDSGGDSIVLLRNVGRSDAWRPAASAGGPAARDGGCRGGLAPEGRIGLGRCARVAEAGRVMLDYAACRTYR